LRLGLPLALEAQLALAFALALTLILILIVRIPEITGHDVSPSDAKASPSLRRIADLLRLRSTNDLRQPFTSIKNDLDVEYSGNRFETNGPQKPQGDQFRRRSKLRKHIRVPVRPPPSLPVGVHLPTTANSHL
jgi:hypothetical protein